MAAIGKNIEKARNKLGLTQDNLVRKSGVKHTTLTKIESDVVVQAKRANGRQNRQIVRYSNGRFSKIDL